MPYSIETHPIGAFACELDYDDTDNPFWFPKFTIHGAGSRANPYMVCDDSLDCSPCARAEKRRMKAWLQQGSQKGSIN